MCLFKTRDVPYNKNLRRYKMLKVWEVESKNQLRSPYHPERRWFVNKPFVAKKELTFKCVPRQDIGIHVFITKRDAINLAQRYGFGQHVRNVVVEMVVDEFVAAGIWDYCTEELRSETWKRATITKVFTASGRHDITHKF